MGKFCGYCHFIPTHLVVVVISFPWLCSASSVWFSHRSYVVVVILSSCRSSSFYLLHIPRIDACPWPCLTHTNTTPRYTPRCNKDTRYLLFSVSSDMATVLDVILHLRSNGGNVPQPTYGALGVLRRRTYFQLNPDRAAKCRSVPRGTHFLRKMAIFASSFVNWVR